MPSRTESRVGLAVVAVVAVAVAVAALGAGAWWLHAKHRRNDAKITREVVKDDVPAPADVSLPECTSACARGAPLAADHLVVVASPREVRVPAANLVLPLPADASHGFDAAYKRSGPNGLYVTKLGEALGRARGDAGDTSLAVVADRATPYGVLVEVLFTAGQNEVRRVFVAERAGGKLTWLESDLPRVGSELDASPCSPVQLQRSMQTALMEGVLADALKDDGGVSRALAGAPTTSAPPSPPPAPPKPHLCPTVIVVHDGFSVKARGGNVAPGCQDVGPGLAVARAPGAVDYDYAALGACLARVKASSPDFAGETEVTVSCNPEVTLGVLVGVWNSVVRSEDGGALFPDLRLGLTR